MPFQELSLVLAGEAGQGIQSIELMLTKIVKKQGLHVFATKEYLSRVRGGVNSTQIRIGERPVRAFVERIDVLVALHGGAVAHVEKHLGPETLILGDRGVVKDGRVQDLPLGTWARELGNPLYANTLAVGVCAALAGVEKSVCDQVVREHFAKKGPGVVEANLKAVDQGWEAGNRWGPQRKFTPQPSPVGDDRLLMSGADAVALGALAGGCNYTCAYPMSPGTSVLEKMASFSREAGILVEQVEDEIGVVNMALGAWYAGARALVTTSGGGFTLMTEGVSLAGIIESPLVVHIAQRPGPGTGLPTRTEQGDLMLAVNAGHGEFLRVVLAPSTLEEGYELSRLAFEIADGYQVPVFLLTDQFFVDSYADTPAFSLPDEVPQAKVVPTGADYRRFAFTESGLSPRGIPGHGEGLVRADSDEHDEAGFIAEDEENRNAMNSKRLKRFELIQKEIPPPRLTGPGDFQTLVVSWGSTAPAVDEALDSLGSSLTAHLHLSWVWPLHPDVEKALARAKKIVVVEQNATGQLADLIQMKTCIRLEHRILKSSGLVFSVEELARELKKELEVSP